MDKIKDNELVEMKIKRFFPLIDMEKELEDTTFNEMLSDEEKVDQMYMAFQNMVMLLVENGPEQRHLMSLLTADEADSLMLLQDDREMCECTLAAQMLKALKQVGVTVEKVVLWKKEDFSPEAKVFMRKPDGGEMDIDLMLPDALSVALLEGLPFYVRDKFLKKQERPEFAKNVPNAKIVLMRMMTDDLLEKQLQEAIQVEDYEYASLVKKEMDDRKQGKGYAGRNL